jgi:hypothetical protein
VPDRINFQHLPGETEENLRRHGGPAEIRGEHRRANPLGDEPY